MGTNVGASEGRAEGARELEGAGETVGTLVIFLDEGLLPLPRAMGKTKSESVGCWSCRFVLWVEPCAELPVKRNPTASNDNMVVQVLFCVDRRCRRRPATVLMAKTIMYLRVLACRRSVLSTLCELDRSWKFLG